MKKFLGLLFVAAMVGVLMSRTRAPRTSEPSREDQPTPAQKSPAPEGPTDTPPPHGNVVEPSPTPNAEPTELSSEAPANATPWKAFTSALARSDGPLSTPAGPVEGGEQSAEPQTQGQMSFAGQSASQVSMQRIQSLIEEGRRVEARSALTKIYLRSRGPLRAAVTKVLDRINRDLVFNPSCLEGARIHVVSKGETLTSIAKKHNVNWRMIARINGIERPERLREKQQLKIIEGKRSLLISKSDFRLTLLIGGDYIKSYPVGIGKDDKTPAGDFVIDGCLVEPDWYPPEGGIIKYGQKGHLLGDRWLGFKNKPGATGLGIHGTGDRASVGTKCSNGCIRMLNEDVCELYDFVGEATTVTIVE